MTPSLILIFAVLLIGAGVAFTLFTTGRKVPRKQYLDSLARYLGAQAKPIEGFENSIRISFVHQNQPFIYEDIENSDFNPQNKTYNGYLKTKTDTNFRLNFVEREKSHLIEQAESLKDIATFHWGKGHDIIKLPATFKEFSVLTNNPEITRALFSDNSFTRVLGLFKNTDSYGRPVMSIDFNGEYIVLKFFPPGPVSPSLSELQNDASSIAGYLKRVLILLSCLKAAQQMQASQKDKSGGQMAGGGPV